MNCWSVDTSALKGNVHLVYGDCLERMCELDKESIDLLLTDPPYGINYVSNRRKVKYSRIVNDKNLDWLDDFANLCYEKLKNDSVAYIFCSWYNIDIFLNAFKKKFVIKNVLVWVKENAGMGDLKKAMLRNMS